MTKAITKDTTIRPQVEKHLPLFTEYMKKYGADVMKKVLTKGHHEGLKIKVTINKKDRYQMMQMLDLTV